MPRRHPAGRRGAATKGPRAFSAGDRSEVRCLGGSLAAMAIDSPHLFDNDFFRQFMKSRRQHRGLTLEQLSQLTKLIDPSGEGVSRVALSRYETGASLPGMRELRLIALSLRVPLSMLVYGGEGSDPMSSYRIELEMRIMEVVNNMVSAEGIVKDGMENDPEGADYLALLEKVKNQSSTDSET